MIRVVQRFTCVHDKPGPVVEVKTRGHSAVLEQRECYCTGKAVAMRREVESWEPEDERRPQ